MMAIMAKDDATDNDVMANGGEVGILSADLE